jgi:diacylglycerol kinase family enzyme
MKTDGIDPKDCYLGGIGLGSSNDFLKPAGMLLGNVPCRIRIEKSVLADVGKVVYTGEDGKERTHYFIVNSSLGITAEANRNFNRGGLPVQFLKPRLLGAAILCAAVKAILRFENIPVSLRVDGPPDGPQGPIDLRLSNLSVLKNPHVSGSYIYDQEIRADDGRLGLNYCSEMSTWELLRTLWDLRQGHFSGKARRVSMAVTKVQVHSDELIALELDGEVVMAKEICFALSQRRINLLG